MKRFLVLLVDVAKEEEFAENQESFEVFIDFQKVLEALLVLDFEHNLKENYSYFSFLLL